MILNWKEVHFHVIKYHNSIGWITIINTFLKIWPTLFFHLLFHYYHNIFNIFTLILLKYLYTLLKEYLLLMNILQKWCFVRHVKTRPLTSKIIFIFNFLSDIELYEEICQHIAGFLRLIINFSLTPFSYCPSFMLNPLLL